ncbi:MAG: sugar phosphate isomerase/epimerase family protein, partial [Planctomycetota bacterium]
MNRLSVITGFLGAVRNRYMQYQGERGLEEKLALASRIEGLDGVEVCYPADFQDAARLKELLADHGLEVSAVNFRSRRTGRWLRGSFTSGDAAERREVVDECRRAIDHARELGCRRITTCTLNDGHDYPFELDYCAAYDFAEEALAGVCEHDPDVRVCIEYKPSDPRVRCLFASAGEALSFCQSVDAPNLGVTLDFGHSLLAGERPAQAACMLARAGRLFYVHVNDNDRLWDWDMIPGAYHFWEFIEFFYYLRKVSYAHDWYAFDVFPKEIDTAENFTGALAATRKLEALAARLE